MAEDSDLERTEPASGRRLEEARREGNVPRSRELGSLVVLMAGVAALWVLGGWLFDRMLHLTRAGLLLEPAQTRDPARMLVVLNELFTDGLTTMLPLFLILVMASLVAPIAVGGFNFSTKAFAFDLMRLNPVSGLIRLFSVHGLSEMLKAILKALLIGFIGYSVMKSRGEESLHLMQMAIEPGLAEFAEILLMATVTLVSGLVLIALIDVPFQLWQYYSKLKMSKDELKQEFKQSEGDPQIKARIRQRQREMARRRMMQEVPKADVVVTNPTHYAVAIRYDGASMRAPRVVAKGSDLVAQQIREVARANQVPLLEAPPLARALYRHAEIGDEVPAALYTAVAEVMAWVFTLRHAASHGTTPPPEPTHLPVPPKLDPAAVAGGAAP
jgi:flagellar biosynthesis protein FlhB